MNNERVRQEGTSMHHGDLLVESSQELKEHTIYFQVSDRGARLACGVRLLAATKEEARSCFREFWPRIEAVTQMRVAHRACNEAILLDRSHLFDLENIKDSFADICPRVEAE
jgi:hypothetical protein